MEIIITERHSKEILNKEAAVHLVSLPVTKAQIISLATCFQRLRVTDHISGTHRTRVSYISRVQLYLRTPLMHMGKTD